MILVGRNFLHKVKGRYAAKPGTRTAQAFGPRGATGQPKQTQDMQGNVCQIDHGYHDPISSFRPVRPLRTDHGVASTHALSSKANSDEQ